VNVIILVKNAKVAALHAITTLQIKNLSFKKNTIEIRIIKGYFLLKKY
jgi:hypothetical protein